MIWYTNFMILKLSKNVKRERIKQRAVKMSVDVSEEDTSKIFFNEKKK